MVVAKSRAKVEYGDFQTPPDLAARVVEVVDARGGFASVLEPTCGDGSLLCAALDRFPTAVALGLDLDAGHLERCRRGLAGRPARLVQGDFFATDWADLLAGLPDPLLVIGNPPWVTNAALGALAGRNLPHKSNRAGRRGIDAITGSSNFDISEWILDHLAGLLAGRDATLAVLCKRAVARKVLASAWRAERGPRTADLYPIDAAAEFGAAAAACLLVLEFAAEAGPGRAECRCRERLVAGAPVDQLIGWRDGELVADLDRYRRWRHLLCGAPNEHATWRSGVKHDCAAVMELCRDGDRYRNGLGERVDLEPDYLYPMLKSSDLARGAAPSRFMLVTQHSVGVDTAPIADRAPLTWDYLEAHGDRLDRRASSVYANKPRFSVFGVGPYTFTPWKVAIAGLYKQLRFSAVGPQRGKPTVVDDTAYFLPCADRAEAERLAAALASTPARELLSALAFWDGKRPITAALLRRLDLEALARHLAGSPASSPG